MTDQPQTPCDPHVVGMARMGADFIQAAIKVKHPDADPLPGGVPGKLDVVAYYLACHSIELYLKAFLFAQGVPESKLRSKDYGHKLDALLQSATVLGLRDLLAFSEDDAALIGRLSVFYSDKAYEYHRFGLIDLPDYRTIIEVNRKLGYAILPYVHQAAGITFTYRQEFLY